jgi:hypothetical protein
VQLSSEKVPTATNNRKKNPAISHIHNLFDVSHRVFTDANKSKTSQKGSDYREIFPFGNVEKSRGQI